MGRKKEKEKMSGLKQSKAPDLEIYRKSMIGVCLVDVLEDMVNQGQLPESLAKKVLVQFDKSINEALSKQVRTKATLKGHLHTFRFCDGVWTFILQHAQILTDTDTINTEAVKIVACDGTAKGAN